MISDVRNVRGSMSQVGGSEGGSGVKTGEFGDKKVTAGQVFKAIGRVALAVVTLGISELVIHLSSRKATTQAAPPESARASRALGETQARGQHLQDLSTRGFADAVAGSVNDKFGLAGDLSIPKKFTDGVHDQFRADANRASYQLNGMTLPKNRDGVIEAFRAELSEQELQVVTGILHQGTSLSVIEQLMFSADGPVQGQLGGAPSALDKETGQMFATNEEGRFLRDEAGDKIPGKTSTYSLERGENGVLKVTIEDRTQMQSSGLFGEDGTPQLTYLDAAKSSLATRITGEIRPGGDPVFQITKPIEYDLRMTPDLTR